MSARGASTAVRALAYVTGFILLWAVLALSVRRFDPIPGVKPPAWLWPAGLGAMVAGAALALGCAVVLVRRGEGTPAPFDPPLKFVAEGPYRYVRNPMYVGSLTFLAGLGLYLQSTSVLLLAVCAGVVVHGFVVLVEEPGLEGRFGESYLQYKRAVGRWRPRLR